VKVYGIHMHRLETSASRWTFITDLARISHFFSLYKDGLNHYVEVVPVILITPFL
jgi:hypothetical protein